MVVGGGGKVTLELGAQVGSTHTTGGGGKEATDEKV